MSRKTSDGSGGTSYYDLPKGAKDVGDIIEHRNMNFNTGNIQKAVYRLGEKDGVDDIYDLNKIIYFAQREKRRLERKRLCAT